MRLTRIIRDERGVALPMAMMVLVLLTTLMMAFALLAQTEPVIAHNQSRTAQALAQAEAGFERGVWALSQGVVPPPAGSGVLGALPSPLPVPAPAPYNGGTFILNGSSGGYQVTVTSPDPVGQPHRRQIMSTGYMPANAPGTARRRVQGIVERFPLFAWETPCALCVRGDLQVGGSALIDGTTDPSCGGYKRGAVTTGTVDIASGSATIKGETNGTPNQDGSDYLQNQTDPSLFAGITLTAANLKALRERAKETNTYFGPGYPNGSPAGSPSWTGSVTFESSNKLKDGIVFIDTVSGNDIPTNLADQNPADFASVEIRGNPFIGFGGVENFTGWLIVNGSLRINGDMKMNGLVYAMNDLTYNGVGTGEIVGLAVSQNIRDTNATAISSTDTTTTGNSRIKFNCNALQPPPSLNKGFTLVKGTYRELTD